MTTEGDGSFDSNQVAGTIGATEAVYVDASGWVFDVERSNWLEIEPVDDRSVFPHSSVTAVGRDLFTFGGERWTSPDGELLGDAWMWIAPAISHSNRTPSSNAPTTSAPPTTRATVATLSDVAYTCGPADAPVVSVSVSSEEPLVATIEIVVLDEVVGSAANVTIGTQPTTYEVEVDLTTEAYDHGEGLVSVRGPDDAVLTSVPVTLRMTNGGCG